MYVVYLEPAEGAPPLKQPFKAFAVLPAVIAFARKQVDSGANGAHIFEVAETDDARKAIAAVKMGRGNFLYPITRHASETFLDRELKRAQGTE